MRHENQNQYDFAKLRWITHFIMLLYAASATIIIRNWRDERTAANLLWFHWVIPLVMI